MRMNDRLQQLALFVRTVETGSFSRAAREFGLTQPSASRAVAALEERLGVKLIARTTRQISATNAGKALLARAREALASFLAAPTRRVALLMAELERAEHNDEGRAREWIARALNAAPDPASTADVAAFCHAHGLVVLTCGTYGNVLRFLPPLVMGEELLEEGLDILGDAFASL